MSGMKMGFDTVYDQLPHCISIYNSCVLKEFDPICSV